MSGSGLYCVFLNLPRSAKIKIGRLGAIYFPAGVYVYVGSAQRNLRKRLERHRKRTKIKRWHMDYLRSNCRWGGCVVFEGQTDECGLASQIRLALNGAVYPAGFGSSDCGCQGHLITCEASVNTMLSTIACLPKASSSFRGRIRLV